MKVLICGAGKVARHLLSRLGERWHVTLIDKSEEKIQDFISKFQNVQKVIAADASSPVTLDDAGVADFDAEAHRHALDRMERLYGAIIQ